MDAAYPHRIRLRDPWKREPLVSESGGVRFRRRFGYPGRIDDYERVWLTFLGVETPATVSLNELPLGMTGVGDFEYEVTALLRPRNELVVEVGEAPGENPWQEIALEVRRAAFLRGVDVVAEEEAGLWRLRISGAVVGSAPRPLELYVVLERSNVAYGLVEASLEGRAFTLVSEELAAGSRAQKGSQRVRVDLVDGATVWYTVDRVV